MALNCEVLDVILLISAINNVCCVLKLNVCNPFQIPSSHTSVLWVGDITEVVYQSNVIIDMKLIIELTCDM